MKIYYAHHVYKYNTKIEEYEIDLIKKYLPEYEIVNPNGDIGHEDLSNTPKIMQKCFEVVKVCDAVVFSSISGVIGKGVYDEVILGHSLGKEVFYITNNKVISYQSMKFEVINESGRIYALVY